MLVFDRIAVRRHRDRAARTVGDVADILRDAAERLLDRLDDTTVRFTRALDIGGRGVVAPLLRARGIEVVSCDLSPCMAALNGAPAVAADEEFLFGEGGVEEEVVNSGKGHTLHYHQIFLRKLRRGRHYLCKAMYQMMAYDSCLRGEQNV